MQIKNSRSTPLYTILGLAVVLGYAPFATALSTDGEQPIEVNADAVSIDESQDLSTYTGNVIVTQGSIRITGDVMKIYGITDELEKIIVTGNPVKFRQRPDGKKQDIRGEGMILKYFTSTEKLHLLNRAKLWQQGNTIRSSKIIYDTNKSVMTAGTKQGKSKARVVTTFQPKKKKKKKAQ